jgi:Glu-tRNA(Gln) amidotransferase subunit E-like FAD-binding protein
MTNTEIAQKLGISKNRVEGSISAYTITKGTKFEEIVNYGNIGAGRKGIPETLIWKIQNSLSRARKLTDADWELLLKKVEEGKINTEHVSELRKILMSDKSLTLKEALDLLGKCRIIAVFFHCNETALNRLMKEEKFNSETEFIKHIVKSYDKDLIF